MTELDHMASLCNTSCMDVALYLRISIDPTGEELGVTRHRADCEALAARRGWNVVAVYEDNDISAAGKKKRPAFEALMADAESGRIGGIVTWSFERSLRSPKDRLRLLDLGRAKGLIVGLVRGPEIDLSTPAGRMLADILGAIALHEIEQKGDRQRRAALQRAEMGRVPLGVRLTGYTAKGELIEDEAALVEWMFRRFAAGESLRGLASALNEQGRTTRHGGRWSPSTVSTILRNPRYAGRCVYMGQENGHRGTWKPVVSEATFDLVASKLADPRRKTSKVGTDRRHLGSGLFLCGPCGEPVSSWSGQRYRCREAHVNRVRPAIDELVLGVVRERLGQPDLANLLPRKESREARELAARIKELRAQLARIEDDYDAGHIDGRRYKVASQKASAALSEALASQAKHVGDNASAGILGAVDPVAAFSSAPLMIQRAVINTLMAVRIFPQPFGWKRFDPSTVQITWR